MLFDKRIDQTWLRRIIFNQISRQHPLKQLDVNFANHPQRKLDLKNTKVTNKLNDNEKSEDTDRDDVESKSGNKSTL